MKTVILITLCLLFANQYWTRVFVRGKVNFIIFNDDKTVFCCLNVDKLNAYIKKELEDGKTNLKGKNVQQKATNNQGLKVESGSEIVNRVSIKGGLILKIREKNLPGNEIMEQMGEGFGDIEDLSKCENKDCVDPKIEPAKKV